MVKIGKREQAITWLLNFAERDLTGLHKRERLRIFHRLILSLGYGSQYSFPIDREWTMKQGLVRLQKSLGQFFQDCLYPVLAVSGNGWRQPLVGHIQTLADEYLLTKKAANPWDAAFLVRKNHPELLAAYDRYGFLGSPIFPNEKTEFNSRAFFVKDGGLHFKGELGGSMADVAVERVISLLAMDPPLPLSAFQRCEGCRTWFSSRRVKRYCSPACNRRIIAMEYQKKRQGDPHTKQRKLFNEKAREYREKRLRKRMSANQGDVVHG